MEQVTKKRSGSDQEITEDLPATEGSDLVEKSDDLVAEIDSILDTDAPSSDDLILDAAQAEKTQKVSAAGRRTAALQSHQARAWTRGGRVD